MELIIPHRARPFSLHSQRGEPRGTACKTQVFSPLPSAQQRANLNMRQLSAYPRQTPIVPVVRCVHMCAGRAPASPADTLSHTPPCSRPRFSRACSPPRLMPHLKAVQSAMPDRATRCSRAASRGSSKRMSSSTTRSDTRTSARSPRYAMTRPLTTSFTTFTSACPMADATSLCRRHLHACRRRRAQVFAARTPTADLGLAGIQSHCELASRKARAGEQGHRLSTELHRYDLDFLCTYI